MASEAIRSNVTDLMQEINSYRYLQHRNHKSLDGIDYHLFCIAFCTTTGLCVALFHDVRQPLIHYSEPMVTFLARCGLEHREQNVNIEGNKKAPESDAEA